MGSAEENPLYRIGGCLADRLFISTERNLGSPSERNVDANLLFL